MKEIEVKISRNEINYDEAVRYMESKVENIHNNLSKELLWFLNHNHVFTQGTSAKNDEVLNSSIIDVIKTNRGGKTTYHGPGQRIVYFMLNLNNKNKDINILSDVQAVKRSVRNLVLMNQYEKPFRPEIYSGIRDQLFEPMTPLTATILAKKVEDVIENFEPRARLQGVRANPDLDRNAYNIAIEFYVVNVPTELVDLTVILERLR